jgi:uncharacterized protein YecE (DUF72 family)
LKCKVGTAGWSVPAEFRRADASHLVQYASTFDAVEINSSFYKVHRTATYQRWAASVPAHFRFSVKLTKTITHEAGLVDCRDEIMAFCDSVAGLGNKLGLVLVQLPRSLEFDRRRASSVFTSLQKRLKVPLVCEPRHLSWFGPAADRLFAQLNIARVSADPALAENTSSANTGVAYYRLHGQPRMYYSSYSAAFLKRLASTLRAACGTSVWCMFDNTALGAAWPNALALQALVKRARR